MRHRLAGAARRAKAFGVGYVLSRLRLRMAGQAARQDYDTWIRLFDTPSPARVARAIEALPERPRFSLLLPHLDSATLASVQAQFYEFWQMVVGITQPQVFADGRIEAVKISADLSCDLQALLDAASGDFVILLEPGDILAPAALFQLARVASETTALIYSDEDRMTAGTRHDPVFKPAFSPELLYDPAALGSLVAWRRSGLRFRPEAASLAGYDMSLRVAEPVIASWGQADWAQAVGEGAIRHVPHVLVHRTAPGSVPALLWQNLLDAHFRRIGDAARAVVLADSRVMVHRVLPDPAPLVSVIIPTRDQATLLAACVSGLRERTDYPALEVLIIDNESSEPDALALLNELAHMPGVRVLRTPGPFNYAAMNNRAAEEASGSVLALLNNDIMVREPGWLCEMVGHALNKDIGAVGAKLLYPDGTLQHAGVVTGIGDVAAHRYRCAPAGLPLRLQSVSAVTGACLVLRREVFLEAGGFDAVALPISYNDVDLCLRLQAKGLRILFTPHAVLDHLESVSRGEDLRPEHVARARREVEVMRQRWGARLLHDPYYSPNLSLQTEQEALAFPPRVQPV